MYAITNIDETESNGQVLCIKYLLLLYRLGVDVLLFINRVSNDERVEGLLRIFSISGFELIYLVTLCFLCLFI